MKRCVFFTGLELELCSTRGMFVNNLTVSNEGVLQVTSLHMGPLHRKMKIHFSMCLYSDLKVVGLSYKFLFATETQNLVNLFSI